MRNNKSTAIAILRVPFLGSQWTNGMRRCPSRMFLAPGKQCTPAPSGLVNRAISAVTAGRSSICSNTCSEKMKWKNPSGKRGVWSTWSRRLSGFRPRLLKSGYPLRRARLSMSTPYALKPSSRNLATERPRPQPQSSMLIELLGADGPRSSRNASSARLTTRLTRKDRSSASVNTSCLVPIAARPRQHPGSRYTRADSQPPPKEARHFQHLLPAA